MAIRKSNQYRSEATGEEFQLELESGDVVTFLNPKRLPTEDGFELATSDDPREVFEMLLGDDFNTFWTEWRHRPFEESNQLAEDVMEFYGHSRGKPRNLPR